MNEVPGCTSVVPAGKRVYGVDVGIILIDSYFPRPLGDIGNAGSFGYPIAYSVAEGLSPQDMVAESPPATAWEALESAARQLTDLGVRSLSTSCGLLARHQRRLADSVGVPVASSSLLQIPLVLKMLPREARIGVLTIDSRSLDEPAQWAGAGVTKDEVGRCVVIGMESTEHFHGVIMGHVEELDSQKAGSEVVAVASGAHHADPSIAAWVLECTNLSPYSALLRQQCGLPVWDCLTLVDLMKSGISGTTPLQG